MHYCNRPYFDFTAVCVCVCNGWDVTHAIARECARRLMSLNEYLVL